MKTTAFPLKHSLNRALCWFALLIPVAFACFALSPPVRATCQEGCLTDANTVLGEAALSGNTGGLGDTATGYWELLSNTTGSFNTANGAHALQSNTTGFDNTANGNSALIVNTTGFENTATGFSALWNNTGSDNTATGASALYFNTSGLNNTATGSYALFVNITGSDNTATGASALWNNTIGSNNTATGFNALLSNQGGSGNTGDGYSALTRNSTGNNNAAYGINALLNNTTGNNNIAIGSNAGANLTTGSNNIDIFNRGVGAEAKTIRIGTQGSQTATFIAGISGASVPGGVGVIVDSSGHLGTVVSSQRFKEAIKPMDNASEAILALQPVTFRYKHDLDPEGVPQFGLVAEDVQKVNPDLVARDDQGNPYTVRYDAVNAMLLNEFIKARRQINSQQKQIEALTAGLQKVSAQLELSKPAPGTVLNKE